ncbi:amino acid adenylation domain-containing protein [Methylomonas sp. UP202]|uniref:amino acid adenylation domain-containing protein n=1 Tax=Methylomonas sp. UP202 TaxID=3040943 RepID=UPI00247AF508|nr:amino acid adenylation domain-containing protein [Methylomonas sp. UP202]WGS85504.1 amino acid adenylation domain-containing protein [Methylomonas sp. UP202]
MNEEARVPRQSYFFPLSFAQQRLWLFQQMQPESTAYNITGALRLTGSLDCLALEAALRQIVERHEILRTTFRTVNGEPSQWVEPGSELILEQKVVAEADIDRQLQICRELAADLAGMVFDLEKGPLIKLQLLTLSDSEHVLLSVVHHIISDGWSMGVFVDEMMKFYSAHQENRPLADLPALDIQYGDYAIWQREWFSGDVRERQLAYWQRQLAGMPPLIALPSDYPRPPVQRFQGSTLMLALSSQTTAALKTLAHRENATMNMVLLTVYFVLLHRYSQEQDLVVGTPVANRNQPELAPLIGFFVNTLVLRARIEPHLTFRELLHHVKALLLAAVEHQDCPFEQIVDQLRPERGLSYSPLIQTLFSYQNAPEQAFELPGVVIEQLQLRRSNAQFDLALMVSENTDDISLEFGYNTDLFKPETIDAFGRHFINCCEAVAANAALKPGSIPLMAVGEYHGVLAAWNRGRQPELKDGNVLQVIERQMALHPDATAVVCGDQRLSYGALGQRASHVARLLADAGVAPGDLVGLCVERSVDMLVAMLAILKAGAAYVPIDPKYPEQRVRLMVGAAGIKHVLSQRSLSFALAHLSDNGTLALFYIEDLLAASPVRRELPEIAAEQLIYMIFTSGSTGVPKGAGVQHRSFANLVLNWYVADFDLRQAASTLVYTSLSFDLTQKNFFAPLVVGGTLYLYETPEYDPSLIVELIDRYRIGWVNATPSAFYPLADIAAGRPGSLASLKYVFLGGEPIALGRIRPWFESVQRTTTVVNSYGPTECADVCLFFPIDPVDRYWQSTVPLGEAIGNARLYVVDEALNPLPFGLPGELCVGGTGVGVGYLNDKARTAEYFLPDPFGEQPGSRLYRTGDQVKFTLAGGFEFLCRNDHQVKVRGFRIDLAEIELALHTHPAVKEAVVTAVKGEREDGYLTAYLVVGDDRLDAAEIRDYLAQRLPHYMVPQKWLMLDKLPLTPSGKVDRRALPDVADDGIVRGALLAPENEIEESLLRIWREVLQVPEIGTEQNFFDLGGHSLTATQIVSRIKQEFDLELPMRVVFEHPSIKRQADWILASQFDALDVEEQADLLGDLARLSDDQTSDLL